jgi:D-3-phosphoglycerate dehydrogenase
MVRILIADPIAQEGIDFLSVHHEVDVKTGLLPEDLRSVIGEYEGMVVRSETKVTADVIQSGGKLQVIGRAGVGVDNIDLEAATKRGIAVVNAPTGNTVAAAEHTIALIMSLARNIPQAHASMRKGEWRRKEFAGVEVRGKTVGIIGLGKVGSEVARRAMALDMPVVAYDPYVPQEYARHLGLELLDLEQLLRRSDFVSIHTPLTNTSRPLIGAIQIKKLKDGARIINTARGGLVDEDALYEALCSGKVAGAALDVFSQEPPPPELKLLSHPNVVITPHLGASTAEAQIDVAREIAEQVLAVLRGEPARFTVNAPFVAPEVHEVLGPYIPVASVLGKLVTQLSDGQFSSLVVKYSGDIAEFDTTVLKAAVVMGVLTPITDERVNLVNAMFEAEQRGLKVTEENSHRSEQYSNMITVDLHTTAGVITVAGTIMRGEAHLVRVDDQWLDVVPSVPYLLFAHHVDRPGMIGAVGTITGKRDINISFIQVGRRQPRGEAMMVVGLDDLIPDHVLEEIRALPNMASARVVMM